MRSLVRRLARPVAGLLILALVLVGVDAAVVADALRAANLPLVVVGVLGLTATHLVPAAAWRSILHTTAHVRLGWRAAVRLYYAAQALGGVTPANLGGDVHRAAALRRSGHDWSAAVTPLVIQRAASYLALSVLAMVALALLAARTPLAGPIVLGGLGVAVAIALAAWTVVLPPSPLRAIRDHFIGPVDLQPGALVEAGALGFGLGLAFHAAAVLLTTVLVLAVEPAVPIIPVLAALVVARLALAVPLTPSGLGLQEGAAAALFAALGLAPSAALAGMLLARLSLLLTTIIGAVLLQHREEMADPRTGSADPSVAR